MTKQTEREVDKARVRVDDAAASLVAAGARGELRRREDVDRTHRAAAHLAAAQAELDQLVQP